MCNTQKGLYAIFGQCRPRSACASAYRVSGYYSICQWAENPQIRLHGCAYWFEPSMFTYNIKAFFTCCASYKLTVFTVCVLKFRTLYSKLFVPNFFFFMQLFLKILSGMTNSVDPDHTAPSGAVWSGSTLFLHMPFCQTLWCLKFLTFTVP